MTKLKILFALLLLVNSIFSQEKIITGKVSSDGSPLPGAAVRILGTHLGTQTDENGKYSIKAKQGDVLEFSFLGKENKSITIGEENSVNVVLESRKDLIECLVITTAYAVSKSKNNKIKIPNQANKISNSKTEDHTTFSDEIVKLATHDFETKNDPIFYINGEKSKKNELDYMDNKSISSIKVLKIKDAVEVFGKKGENGALIIETENRNYYPVEKLNKKFEKKDIYPSNLDFEEIQETYESFIENPFENAISSPLSTFSIDVDNASYTKIRSLITNGETIPKDAVRVEEMMNFFKYSYAPPKNEHPFSIQTEYGSCPWNNKHKLVQIGLQGKEIPTGNLPNSNFVFLIDVSGSMSAENRLPLVIESLKILTKQLRKDDKISIVVYAGAAGLVLPATSGNEKDKINEALENLDAGGSTAGGEGIKLAYKIAEENFIKGGNNRVIIATDGDFNVGASSDSDMISLIEEKRESDVFLTCLGYGMGNYKDSKLEKLADNGNGNYAYIDNMQEANRFLSKEFKGSLFAIAKDVKIQIEFNPKLVQSYRLIGYENRKLHPKDFTNYAIDAGELGSGHSVTALYEIIPVEVKSEYSVDTIDLKYSNTITKTNTFTNELATIKFRYKKPDGKKSIEIIQTVENKSSSLDNNSDDFKFCAAVAWFGLTLKDSKFVPNKNKKDIIELALKSKSEDKDGYRSEFITLIESVE